jgi:hypothetical protein
MRINERELFKSVMVSFMTDEDPMLAMLKWITEQLMQIEVETKAGANKNEHSNKRKTYFSGYRPRRFPSFPRSCVGMHTRVSSTKTSPHQLIL